METTGRKRSPSFGHATTGISSGHDWTDLARAVRTADDAGDDRDRGCARRQSALAEPILVQKPQRHRQLEPLIFRQWSSTSDPAD